jgi:hypothetical protein
MIAEQVKHHQVLFRLREHDTALPAQPQLKDTAAMDLANAQPGMTMRLAERLRQFLHGVGELLAKVERSAFKLTLDAP